MPAKQTQRRLKSVLNDACSEAGAAAVEIALASTVFLLALIGGFQMTKAFYTYHFVDEAAREGTRYAIVRGSTSCTNTPSLTNCDATKAEIQSYVQSLPGAKSMTVNVSYFTASTTQPTTWSACSTGTCNAPGNLVKIQVVYSFPLGIPFVTSRTLSLQSSSSLVIAQ